MSHILKITFISLVKTCKVRRSKTSLRNIIKKFMLILIDVRPKGPL